MHIVKSTFNAIVQPFTYICNLSFESGVFPDKMKITKVIPLFKTGENSNFTDYRPVSLLPQFSKILEKLFDVRLKKCIDKYQLLSNSQDGFRNNMSISLALVDLVEELSSNIDNKLFTVGVFIDLKKTFDTIDHTNLIRKLEFYGIRGLAGKWVSSYITARLQYVSFDGVNSDVKQVLYGVPQGSILGPKLFILYINDICKISSVLNFILFADDTKIFCSGKDLDSLCRTVSSELNKLSDWFAVNKVSLYIAKTSFMIFSKWSVSENLEISINDFKLVRVCNQISWNIN